MTPIRHDPKARDGRSQLVCGHCGKPSTVLVLDPGKLYVYLCASCEADNPAEDETVQISDTNGGNPA